VIAAIWDHIYRGGVQGGGIPGASENAGKEAPHLVFGVTAENLVPYTKAALLRFLEVFPELDGLQFRMHGESGLKREEMEGFWHDVFGIIHERNPNIRVDLRAKELPDSIINDALSQGLKVRVTTKYWMEQMGMPFHPTHINRQNQRDRRHGYADLLRYRRNTRSIGVCGTAAQRAFCSGAIRTTSSDSPPPHTSTGPQLRDQRDACNQDARVSA